MNFTSLKASKTVILGGDLGLKFFNNVSDVENVIDGLDEAIRNPHLVQMDLGQEWFDQSGLPMVFGVFAARRDSPAEYLAEALQDLLKAQNKFSDLKHREHVVARSAERSKFSSIRIEKYFSKVSNNMFDEEVAGLKRFLSEVCGVEDEPTFFEP